MFADEDATVAVAVVVGVAEDVDMAKDAVGRGRDCDRGGGCGQWPWRRSRDVKMDVASDMKSIANSLKVRFWKLVSPRR